jgi:hypothetical protein
MSSQNHQGSHLIRLVCWLVAVALMLSFALSTGAAQAASGGNKLSKHNRELLAEAVAQGKSTVTVLIAARPGANKSVVSGIAGLGGTVRYRDDDVSYIRATVPTGKVEAAAGLSGVQALDVDEVIPLDDPRPDGAGSPEPADHEHRRAQDSRLGNLHRSLHRQRSNLGEHAESGQWY